MVELKEVGIEERFLYELIDLRKRLDLLIRDFQAVMTVDEKRKPMTKELINPLTGKPFIRNKKKKSRDEIPAL